MTTFQKIALPFCLGCLLAFSWVIAFKLGQHYAPDRPDLPVNVQTDTLVIRDTIREKEPVFLTKYVDRVELVPVTDTIRRTDTLYMAVDIERRDYAGEDYKATVSGWRPSLDYIEVFPKTVYIQTEITQPSAPASRRGPRAGIGIAAGPGAFWTPQAGVQFGAGAVVGLSVTF